VIKKARHSYKVTFTLDQQVVLKTMFDIKNMVWKPTFNVIVSDCALKSFVFDALFARVIKCQCFE